MSFAQLKRKGACVFAFHLLTLCSLSLHNPLAAAPIQIPGDLCSSDCKDILLGYPSDAPFTTEVAFMAYCDHRVTCIDAKIDPDHIKPGDAVFVADWYMTWFLKTVHPFIKYPYILVSGESDGMHPGWEERLILYDPKIAAWFCKNLTLSNHPKCKIWSHGPTLAQWRWHKLMADASPFEGPMTYFNYFSHLVENLPPKIEYPLLFLNMTSENHPTRPGVLKLFKGKDYCYTITHSTDRGEFWQQLARMQFVLAPRGIGVDTSRAWEAIALDTIPIVQHSSIDAAYEGSPTILVHSWSDATEEFLRDQRSKIKQGLQNGTLSKDKIYFKYWADQMDSVKKSIREGTWKNAELEATKFDAASIETLSTILLENTGPYNHLIVCGQALSLRLFQLVQHFGSKFCKTFIGDRCAFEKSEGKGTHAKRLSAFCQDRSLFTNPLLEEKLVFVNPVDIPYYVKREKDWLFRVFMDLTYSRYNFTQQLGEFCNFLPAGTIICGNRADDPYVQELLSHFSNQHPYAFIQITEGFWHFAVPVFGVQ